ncbi:hypothetical protein OWV82_022848 [Melia azedarach]|uniref:Uncharacterized protein n=1 Tax=Melia azedarach TaxID=155640 RepID=A0ACC1WUJ6_MELAZ|nr:hypothetical protein OWV82_022848 [Melia azedarach]
MCLIDHSLTSASRDVTAITCRMKNLQRNLYLWLKKKKIQEERQPEDIQKDNKEIMKSNLRKDIRDDLYSNLAQRERYKIWSTSMTTP